MAVTKNTIICVAIIAVLAVGIGCRRASKPVGPVSDLEHFEGVMDERDQTYDHALSDLRVRASEALKAGDAKIAEGLYREILAKYPNDPDSYTSLGTCLYFEHKYEDAEAEYLRALKLQPQSAPALYGLGCVAYKQKRYPEALDNLEKALAINEKHGLSHRVMGMVYDEMDDRANAIRHFERAVELDPENAGDDYVRRRLHDLK
jgi:tetratricopeptide (TPR) repeat protein